MIRDPFYQKIVEALNQQLEGTTFEACVNDLLRPEWPNLIPVPGGNDAGLDGAFVDDDGKRGMVVATTEENVIGNVTRNLREHIAKGRSAWKVIVATSRPLTAAQCRNIEKRIRELGFIPAHHPYTQEAIANRLYHNSRWLKELLGLTGGVNALSSIPVGNRPLRELPLIGRENELRWLRETPNDRLIIGQPGIGKTFLSQAYVKEGRGLFVTSGDIERLTNAIRDQQPAAIVVEDAHLKLPLLAELIHYRREVGADFAIVADCWTGAANDVATGMMLPKANQLELQPLSADLIVYLTKAVGIHGPDYLLQQIVRQSLGCPGRAALLACAVRSSRDVRDIYNGRAFADWAYPVFRTLAGKTSLQLLACIALGGDAGMPLDAVAKFLGYPLGEISQQLADVSLGGVVHRLDDGDGDFCILPESFRSALVADHFFGRHTRLPHSWALIEPVNQASVVEGLIRARARGADISLGQLNELVEKLNDSKCWESFLWHDETAARAACERHPELLLHFPKASLEQAPDLVIPRLLEQAIGDNRNLNSYTDHPIRVLQDWVHSAGPSVPRSVDRRKKLWNALRPLFAGDRENMLVALKALQVAVTPQWESHSTKPGDGRSVIFRHGCIDEPSLRLVAELWKDALEALPKHGEFNWPLILAALHGWCFPGAFGGQLTETQIELFRKTAEMLVRRLAQLAEGKPAILAELEWRASQLKFDLPVQIDRQFRLLFPGDKKRPVDGDWTSLERAKQQAANDLASEWSLKSPVEVIPQWAWFINEAKRCERVAFRHSEIVAWYIATHNADIQSWLQAVLEAQMPQEILRPFLHQASIEKTDGWQKMLLACLEDPCYRVAAIAVGIRADEMLDEAIEAMLVEAATLFPQAIESSCWEGKVPTFRLAQFLKLPESSLAGTVAAAMWHATSQGHAIPNELRCAWRQVMIYGQIEDFVRAEIFKIDPQAAFEWLKAFATKCDRLFEHQESVAAANQVVSAEQKTEVLGQCNSDSYSMDELVAAIVGEDADVYQSFLQDESKKVLHLSPLRGEPDESWARLALMALESGYSPRDIVGAAFGSTEAFCGHLYEQYIEQAQKWAALKNHSDHRVCELAMLGEKRCRQSEAHWREHETREDFWDLYG